MFQRRSKPHLIGRFRNFIWPRSGWRRSSKYVFHRVARIPGSPYSLAGGFACGAAISFTPFVGLHFVISAILAFLIRGNILASVIGTAVGNPWTFPFIWTWIYNFGLWMGAGSDVHSIDDFDFPEFFGTVMDAFLRFDITFLFDTAWPVFWPMFVGGVPTAIAVWFIFYIPMRPMIESHQKRQRQRLMKTWENK